MRIISIKLHNIEFALPHSFWQEAGVTKLISSIAKEKLSRSGGIRGKLCCSVWREGAGAGMGFCRFVKEPKAQLELRPFYETLVWPNRTNFISTMHLVQIDSFIVEFPFEPYKCQIKFMEKVMEALRTGQNAALESPTGTGKTLCLLCAAIAYLKDCKSKISQTDTIQEIQGTSSRSLYPKILYASRTHSQLAQVIRELNKTTYKDIKTVTLASRDVLCINDKVMKENNSHVKSLMCRNLISKHRCPFYNFYEKADPSTLDSLYSEDGLVPDIEEVISISQKHKYCPYFRNRTMYENADLILLPYNYIIDPSLRHKHNIQLKGNIVIFDEAHNLESICEESTSVSFSTTQISACIRETKKVLEMIINDEEEIRTKMARDNTTASFGTEIQKTSEVKIEKNDVAYLLASLHHFEDNVDVCMKDKGEKVIGIDGKVYPSEKMIELLSKAGFRKDMKETISLTIDKIGQYLTAKAHNESAGEFIDKGVYLQEFSSFISTVYADKHASSEVLDSSVCAMRNVNNSSAKCFQLYVTEHGSVITLNYWCFSPSVAMYLHSSGVRSVIVTSGTLSPLNSFVNSLGISFPVTLENQHAANLDQILGARIRFSQGGIDLCGTFHRRSSAGYIYGVGEVIIRACQIIPGGILVFFSSYVVMNSCLKFWKTTKFGTMFIWETIMIYKEAFIEPKSKLELKTVLLQFRQKVREGSGAILFAVCRAKVSEGIDFSDNESRGVIVIGIPYAPTTNPRIELKKQFLTKQRIGLAKEELKKNISADEWYQVDAIRGVNQSIGRVLRHKDDFGVVILVDSRFCTMPSKRFPLWMRECLKNYQNISHFENECNQFFKKRNMQAYVNHRKSMEIEAGSVCARKRHEILKWKKANIEDLPFDIDTLYSSEAVAAFEKSIGVEDTVPKRPRRSCIFEELEEVNKINELVDVSHPTDINDCNFQSGSGLIIRKTKPRLRLKHKSLLMPQPDAEIMTAWKRSAVEYNKLLQSIEKSKRLTLKMALTNYAADSNFQTLISTFTVETVPNHLEIFKGLYEYLLLRTLE
uniref:Helicase ATP-binding domain-containing protein n=1 Tax=Elaeophora elaphi TaxID=1147741 RepID=A0A0R3RHF6_9BILA